MNTRETSQSIDRAAAEWAARFDCAPLTQSEEEQLNAWLQGDVRRQGAFLRAQALLIQPAEPVVEAEPAPSRRASIHVLPQPVRQSESRRKGWMRFGGMLAAGVAVATIAISILDSSTAYATVKGETRTLPLSDGSTITLNTDTHIKVYDDDGHSRVNLLRGELFVHSAADEEHPLVVEVDGRKLQAVHAAFNVSKLEDAPLQVTVLQGQLELTPTGTIPQSVIASGNSLSVLSSGKQIEAHQVELSRDEMGRKLAWREGKLAFHGETLADAARAFYRYSDTRIVITDPALANSHVIGLYAASNPVGFARAAAKVLGARIEQSDNEVVIAANN